MDQSAKCHLPINCCYSMQASEIIIPIVSTTHTALKWLSWTQMYADVQTKFKIIKLKSLHKSPSADFHLGFHNLQPSPSSVSPAFSKSFWEEKGSTLIWFIDYGMVVCCDIWCQSKYKCVNTYRLTFTQSKLVIFDSLRVSKVPLIPLPSVGPLPQTLEAVFRERIPEFSGLQTGCLDGKGPQNITISVWIFGSDWLKCVH